METKCFQKSVLKDALQSTKCYIHHDKRILIKVEIKNQGNNTENGITMWGRCKICQKSTIVNQMSKETYNYSFGKFLETSFYNSSIISSNKYCQHSIHHDYKRYFAYQNIVNLFL